MNRLRSCSIGWLILTVWDRLVQGVSRALFTTKTKAILRLLGGRYGRNFRVDGPVLIRAQRKEAITVGENVTINSRRGSNLVGLTGPAIFQCIRDGRIRIGNNVGLSSAMLSARSSIEIGDRVLLGGNVRIYDHDFHALDYRQRQQDGPVPESVQTAPVVIGNDVFIGVNAIILKGVHIGNRSVIGAGSVVTLKEIPPDSLVAGNPACILGTRNTRLVS